MSEDTHWNAVYSRKAEAELSWHQSEPSVSLDLMEKAGVTAATSVIDVGGGTSRVVDALISRGLSDLTVLDLSQAALDAARSRLGPDESALLNLCVNARDAMPGGGILRIETCASSLAESAIPDAPAAGEYVRIAVSDTGEGMDEDKQIH